MSEFIEKWKNDKKFRALIKIALYVVFIVGSCLIAGAISPYSGMNDLENEETSDTSAIVKKEANYTYKIKIDDINYTYHIKTENGKQDIIKETTDGTTHYIYENNNYYQESNGNYLKTTEESVYDIIDYYYLNIDNINLYLEKAEKNNQEYLVYLKDVILNNDSEEYFVVLINDKQISIDYSPLLKKVNSDDRNYQVQIITEE